jgi:hypothetical protein
MEETKESTPVADQPKHEEESGPLLKNIKREVTEKQGENLRLGREKAKMNREAKVKAKLEGYLDTYLKEKSEASKTTQHPPTSLTLPLPPTLKYSSASDSEELERLSSLLTFLDSASSDWQPPVLQRTHRYMNNRAPASAFDLNFT